MASVYFDEKHSKLVEVFCSKGENKSGRKIFSHNTEFMVFAAMVGRKRYDSCDDVEIKRDKSHEIKESYFGDKDGIAFTLALEGSKDGEIMRKGNENEIWKYLEKYAYLGCNEIQKWIVDSPMDDPYDVVLEKIMDAAEPLAKVEKNKVKSDSDF